MQNDINIDFADYQTILLHKGKIDGVVGSCKVEYFISSLSENLKLSLKNSKGVLIEFEQHSDASSTIISSLMEELHDLIGEDTDVTFGAKQNDTIEKESIKFKIIATGMV